MLVLRSGGTLKEVPVILEERSGASSVSLAGDGYEMIPRTLELRRRLRHWTPREAISA